jgi:hypothetical protein|tara:strand:- start:17 stop:361 length:345 start_codon:yes stop_codon:yes gene_type:complete
MKKKVIGEKYGVQITRPWNKAMYHWNDLAAKLIKIDIFKKLEEFYEDENIEGMNLIAQSFGAGYGDGYDVDSMYAGISKDLGMVENYQLNEELEWLVRKEIINEPKFGFVGYDK